MDAKRSLQTNPAPTPAESDGFSLPGWIYRDADFLEAEKERVFATSWQVVCHLNDIPHPGRLSHAGFPRRALGGGAPARIDASRRFSMSAGTAHRACWTAAGPLRRTHRVPLPRLDLRS